MTKTSTFGDNLTLIALAREFNCQFLIINSNGFSYHRLISSMGTFDPDLLTFTLGFFPEIHYVSVSVSNSDLLQEIIDSCEARSNEKVVRHYFDNDGNNDEQFDIGVEDAYRNDRESEFFEDEVVGYSERGDANEKEVWVDNEGGYDDSVCSNREENGAFSNEAGDVGDDDHSDDGDYHDNSHGDDNHNSGGVDDDGVSHGGDDEHDDDEYKDHEDCYEDDYNEEGNGEDEKVIREDLPGERVDSCNNRGVNFDECESSTDEENIPSLPYLVIRKIIEITIKLSPLMRYTLQRVSPQFKDIVQANGYPQIYINPNQAITLPRMISVARLSRTYGGHSGLMLRIRHILRETGGRWFRAWLTLREAESGIGWYEITDLTWR